MASSVPNSESALEVSPLHRLHDAQEAVRVGSEGGEAPHRMPLTRKVAAGPPIPTYKGQGSRRGAASLFFLVRVLPPVWAFSLIPLF